MGIEVPIRAQYIRVMFDEITRILNHLLWLGAHDDVGAMAVFLYAFREREDLMDCYKQFLEQDFMRHTIGQVVYIETLPDQMPKYSETRMRSKSSLAKLNENRSGSALIS